jgi:archaellum component FlaC
MTFVSGAVVVFLLLTAVPIVRRYLNSTSFQEFWEKDVIVAEKTTKVQLMDSNLKQAIQIQMAENENAWSKRLDGVEAKLKAIENRLDTLEARSEGLEKSAKAVEVKTSDLHLDVKKLLERVPNQAKEAKPKGKPPSP